MGALLSSLQFQTYAGNLLNERFHYSGPVSISGNFGVCMLNNALQSFSISPTPPFISNLQSHEPVK
eukprot:m.186788 g.186788  ORF g.186788 m.186788 type:complete len:66 (+) comp25603_c0_seq3:101-298(+)